MTAAVANTGAAATNPSQVAGGCQVTANARLTPGLTLGAHAFHYSYTGTLTNCFYTGTGGANGGVISAGRPIMIAGHAYQEPIPSGAGTCLATNAEGYDFARWNNGTQTIVKFTTTSSAGVTHLTGSVIPSLRLHAVRRAAGTLTSATFRTTNFNGQNVAGVLEFHASDPSRCAKAPGLDAATITGVLSHNGIEPAPQTIPPGSPPPTGGRCRAPATATRHGQTQRNRPCRQPNPMLLSSPAVRGGQLPASASCTGGGTSPVLKWRNVPRGTQQLELLVTDPDGLHGTVSHWVVYSIRRTSTGSPTGSAPPGAQQGVNSFGAKSYLPACPLPPGSIHQYVFELFASRHRLKFAHSPTDGEVRTALRGNVLAVATLIATFALKP